MTLYLKAAKEAVSEWFEDGAMEQAAALAFYSIFALAPLVVICTLVVGSIFGEEEAQQELLHQARNLAGTQGEQAVATVIEHAEQPDVSRLSFVVSFAVLLFSASIVFAQLQTSMNRIWNVVQRPDLGIWFKVKSRLFSMGLAASLGFLLIVSLVLSTVLATIGSRLSSIGSGGSTLMTLLNFIANATVFTFLLAAIFKVIPDVQVRWREVWVGALATALLFMVGQLGIGYYLGNSRLADAYGAAASVIILLIWMYYSCLILFYGAEFTQSYAKLTGNRLVPAGHAMRLVVEARPAEDKEAEHKIVDKSAAERRRG